MKHKNLKKLKHETTAGVMAGWQVTLCDPIWHMSSRSGEAGLLTKGESAFSLV